MYGRSWSRVFPLLLHWRGRVCQTRLVTLLYARRCANHAIHGRFNPVQPAESADHNLRTRKGSTYDVIRNVRSIIIQYRDQPPLPQTINTINGCGLSMNVIMMSMFIIFIATSCYLTQAPPMLVHCNTTIRFTVLINVCTWLIAIQLRHHKGYPQSLHSRSHYKENISSSWSCS